MILTNYLVEFSPKSVSEFEKKYRSRITSETLNSLIIIGDCNLIYMSRSQILSNYKIDIHNAFPGRMKNVRSTIPVLVINQVARFDMDQVESFSRFPFVYSIL